MVLSSLNRPNIFYSVQAMKGYRVRSGICLSIYMYTPHSFPITICYISSLFYVLQTDLAGIARWLTSLLPSSVPKTLIFTQTKNIACKMYGWLSQCAATKTCVNMYHASLTHTTKTLIQEEFSSPQADLRCLVSTVAFGMVHSVAT